MKLVTKFELAAKSKNELHALLKEAFNELARTLIRAETHWHLSRIFSLNWFQGRALERDSRMD